VGFVIRDDLERSAAHPSLRRKMVDALAVMPDLAELKEAAERLGYVEDPALRCFRRVSIVGRTHASLESLLERRGEGRETIDSIPELYDPRIFFEHPPTQSPFATRERMRMEGVQDAECVRRYLFAYQSLMESPTVAHLYDATVSPHLGASYYLAMRHCLEAGVSDDFISLLHVTFALQWVIDSRPYSESAPPNGSRGLFPEDVDLMASAIQRYCLGQER